MVDQKKRCMPPTSYILTDKKNKVKACLLPTIFKYIFTQESKLEST